MDFESETNPPTLAKGARMGHPAGYDIRHKA